MNEPDKNFITSFYFYRMPQLQNLLASIACLLVFTNAANAQVYGCKDPNATNFNVNATHNDGSCQYAATTINATQIALLSDTLKETSGLAYWNNLLWTHNDDTDPYLYALDTTDGHIVHKVKVENFASHDWEEITQDDTYFYLGDFGNNGNGNRQDLKIFKILKTALAGNPTTVTPVDSIAFSYQDQSSFAGTGNNNTNFDCESFLASDDSLYLFNKQWVSGKTKLYTLPKTGGTYSAIPKTEYDVNGLITGAAHYALKKRTVLSGYMRASALYQPFVLVLYDYNGNQFLSGNKRKILINIPLHQIEGIATQNGNTYFISNEEQPSVAVANKLQKIDLSSYFNSYYLGIQPPICLIYVGGLQVYPNPTSQSMHLRVDVSKAAQSKLAIVNALGQEVASTFYHLDQGINEMLYVLPTTLPKGIYTAVLSYDGHQEKAKVSIQ